MCSFDEIKRAIEERNADGLTALYADNAVMRIIDRDHPPSAPREIRGKPDIAAYFADVCGRAMTHAVESGVEDGSRLAFTQACAYPDGVRVFCSAMLELTDGGKIARETIVQAWDA